MRPHIYIYFSKLPEKTDSLPVDINADGIAFLFILP